MLVTGHFHLKIFSFDHQNFSSAWNTLYRCWIRSLKQVIIESNNLSFTQSWNLYINIFILATKTWRMSWAYPGLRIVIIRPNNLPINLSFLNDLLLLPVNHLEIPLFYNINVLNFLSLPEDILIDIEVLHAK